MCEMLEWLYEVLKEVYDILEETQEFHQELHNAVKEVWIYDPQ